MKSVNPEILEQVIAESAEPVVIVRVDHSEPFKIHWISIAGRASTAEAKMIGITPA